MDRKIEKKFNAKPWIYALLIIGAILIGFRWLKSSTRAVLTSDDVILATVKRGNMESTITAVGITKPSKEIVITSPLTAKIKKVVADNGAAVQPNEAILRLDADFALTEYGRLKDELKLKENNVNRLRLSLNKEIKDIAIDVEIEELQVSNLKSKLRDLKQLVVIGGATQEEVNQLETQLNILELRKRKLENDLTYRRASIDSDVKNEELQSAIQRTIMNQLGKKIDQTSVVSPITGVVTWINDAIGTQVQEGDKLAKVADLSSYYIEATASDMHSKKIKINQAVHVRINEDFIDGKITQILPSVDNGTVKFVVSLGEADSALLRTNMKVDIQVVQSQKENTLYVTNGRAYRGGKRQKFFVQQGDQLVQKEMIIGVNNSKNIELIEGAKEGDVIVISNMDRYEDEPTISYTHTSK